VTNPSLVGPPESGRWHGMALADALSLEVIKKTVALEIVEQSVAGS
jgi:hypothetical protein